MCWRNSGWMWGHGWFGGWLLTALVLTVFFAVVITGIVVAIRYPKQSGSAGAARPAPTTAAAEDLLAHRFARGEIDETDFRQRITALKEHR